jgi:putative transcriptional regulator
MTKFGNDLIAALQEALAHARGNDVGVRVHHVDMDQVDVRAIRRRAGLKQHQMAPLLGVSVSGYRKWEQGKRCVSGPARALLTVMEREPEAVVRALFGSVPARPKEAEVRPSKTTSRNPQRKIPRRAAAG